MRAVRFARHGSVDELQVEDIDPPVCGEEDVIIRVGAVSLNGFDPMILGGTTSLKTPFPMIPGGDYAGTIVEVGSRVSGWAPGDRVCPNPFVPGEGMTGETRHGAAAELARIPAANLIRTPDGVTDIEAAALPIAYGTAFRMLVTRGKVSAGERVLILGAAGGVGTGCVQFAKALGAEVIAVARGDWKLERLRELGADHVIDTAAGDYVAQVHQMFGKPRMTGGGGVDVVVNYIGGDDWVRGLRCLSPRGRMLTCGASAGYAPQTDIRYIWTYELSVLGSNGWTTDELTNLLGLVDDGFVKPVIHAVRPLNEMRRSMQELVDRQVFGKSIILPQD